MTKKKLALLEIVEQQIKDINRQILLLELDRKILWQEYFERSKTDEVEPLVEEVIETPEPIQPELKREVIIDSVTQKDE